MSRRKTRPTPVGDAEAVGGGGGAIGRGGAGGTGVTGGTGGTEGARAEASIDAWVDLALAATVAALAMLRAVVSFHIAGPGGGSAAGDAWPAGAGGFGPVATAGFDLLHIAVLLGVIGWFAARRRAVHGVLIGLWFGGAGFALVNVWRPSDAGDAINWVGAWALGLAALHLGRRRASRRLMIAALVALLAPLALDAGYDYFVQHERTVGDYLAHREQALGRQGIEPGTVAQRKFEARLMQREATGPFGLSNVFASVIAGLTLAASGAAAGAVMSARAAAKAKASGHAARGAEAEADANVAANADVGAGRRASGLGWRWIGVAAAGALAFLGVGTLVMTHSRGAAAALIVSGATVAAIGWPGRRVRGLRRWVMPAAVMGLIVLAVGAVVVRGALGPPATAEGERSLLFRFHYLQASGRMIAEQPVGGVGPGWFGQAYLQAKNPLNPEDVALPHNVFAAWLASMGIGGLAWAVALVVLAWRAVAAAATKIKPPAASEHGGGRRGRVARVAGLGLVVFGVEFAVNFAGYADAALGVTLIMGLLGFVAWRGIAAGGRTERVLGVAIAAAAIVAGVVLLPTVGLWAGGVAAWAGASVLLLEPGAWRAAGRRYVGLGLAAAVAAIVVHAQIEMNLTHAMSGPLLMVVIGVAAAGAAGTGGVDADAGPGRSAAFAARRRRWLAWVGAALVMLVFAGSVARFGGVAGAPAKPLATVAGQIAAIKQAGAGRGDADRLVGLWQRLLGLNPYDVQAHLQAADDAWRLGRRDTAAAWYRRTLELNDLAYLDPDAQLTAGQVATIRQRLGER